MNPWILEFHGQEKKRKEKENEERSEIEKKNKWNNSYLFEMEAKLTVF